MMKPNLGIADKDRDGVVTLLTGIQADEYVLYTTTRHYDFLTGLMKKHEKMAWLLSAFLK